MITWIAVVVGSLVGAITTVILLTINKKRCDHKYKNKDKITEMSGGYFGGFTYILQCEKCGKIIGTRV